MLGGICICSGTSAVWPGPNDAVADVSQAHQGVVAGALQVFLLNTQVTLLSSVLDTPSFFGSAPDHLQALYERALEYLGA